MGPAPEVHGIFSSGTYLPPFWGNQGQQQQSVRLEEEISTEERKTTVRMSEKVMGVTLLTP